MVFAATTRKALNTQRQGSTPVVTRRRYYELKRGEERPSYLEILKVHRELFDLLLKLLFQLDELLRRQRHKVDTFLFTLLSHDSFLLVTKGYE